MTPEEIEKIGAASWIHGSKKIDRSAKTMTITLNLAGTICDELQAYMILLDFINDEMIQEGFDSLAVLTHVRHARSEAEKLQSKDWD